MTSGRAPLREDDVSGRLNQQESSGISGARHFGSLVGLLKDGENYWTCLRWDSLRKPENDQLVDRCSGLKRAVWWGPSQMGQMIHTESVRYWLRGVKASSKKSALTFASAFALVGSYCTY